MNFKISNALELTLYNIPPYDYNMINHDGLKNSNPLELTLYKK